MGYEGIKIYNKVIIVENSHGQGYVVDCGNKKMLESAFHWARLDREWDSEKSEWKDIEVDKNKYCHEYENGKFELTLSESADSSSQGGKLSFWNCKIKGPDNKEYLIGINSELLLHLLVNADFSKGKCNSKIWLGRVKGNQVGAFTETMSEFAQAKEDEKQRTASKTKNYEVGDVVTTLTQKELYLGEFYKFGDYYKKSKSSWGSENVIRLFDKPKKVYGFIDLDYKYYIKFTETKPARIISGEKKVEFANKLVGKIKNYLRDYKLIKLNFSRYVEELPNNSLFRCIEDTIPSNEEVRREYSEIVGYAKQLANNLEDDYSRRSANRGLDNYLGKLCYEKNADAHGYIYPGNYKLDFCLFGCEEEENK